MLRNDDPTMRWLGTQNGGTVLGTPPLTAAPNPLMHKPDQVPFAGRPGGDLTVEENRQRQKWMADEAHRLIAQRQQTVRPASPVTTNQFYNPTKINVNPQRDAADNAAKDLINRLAVRDRGIR